MGLKKWWDNKKEQRIEEFLERNPGATKALIDDIDRTVTKEVEKTRKKIEEYPKKENRLNKKLKKKLVKQILDSSFYLDIMDDDEVPYDYFTLMELNVDKLVEITQQINDELRKLT